MKNHVKQRFLIGMHRILILTDIRPAGNPANPKAGYLALQNSFFFLTIIYFCKHKTKHDLVTKIIFVQFFFLALFEGKLYKFLD
jgi:hypothetical protein